MLVTEVEETLSSGPFGDSVSLATNSDSFYAGVTALFADVFPDFRLTWPWPASPQARILVRGYLDESLIHLRTDRSRAETTAMELIALLDQAAGHPQDALRADGAFRPVTLTAWGGNPLAERIDDRFHQTMRNDGHDFRITLVVPEPEVDAAIDAAFDLLAELLPHVGPSAAALVHGLGIFDGNLSSAFINGTPALIYVNRAVLIDPLRTADDMLHECLHQKLVEVGLTRRMLRNGYADATSHKIHVPWGGTGRLFSVDRSLAAFHVYVHCALLHLAALGRTDMPPEELDDRLAIRWGRADFFGRELSTPEAAVDLGPEGRQLVAWLRAANERLGTATTGAGRPLSEAGHHGE